MPTTTLVRQSWRPTDQSSLQRLERLEARRLFSSYMMTDLGTLGGTTARPYDLNDFGYVVGASTTATGQSHAFVWKSGVMTDLGTLAGAPSQANAISNSGQIAGTVGPNSTSSLAVRWSAGEISDLGLGSGSTATGINDAGQVVGDSAGGRAFLWQHGAITDLGTLPGGSGASAADINNAGQVVGIASTGEVATIFSLPVNRAFLWQDGVMTDLSMPLGSFGSQGCAISPSGRVVGSGSFMLNTGYGAAAIARPLVYQGSAMITLPTPSTSTSLALDVNDDGQVVGLNGYGAFLYQNGVMSNLNSVTPAGSGVTLIAATGINKSGQIVAYSSGTQPHAFLLTPAPPPMPAPAPRGAPWGSVRIEPTPSVSLDDGSSATVI